MWWLALKILGPVVIVGLIYGWGSDVINRYSEMPKRIEQLERDKSLIESRVASLRTLMARRDAAIEASKCKAQIKDWIRNPDKIPTAFDPFNQLNPK